MVELHKVVEICHDGLVSIAGRTYFSDQHSLHGHSCYDHQYHHPHQPKDELLANFVLGFRFIAKELLQVSVTVLVLGRVLLVL